MTGRPPRKLATGILAAGLVASVAVLAITVWYLGVLLVRVNELEGRVDSTAAEVEAASAAAAAVRERSAELESRLTALERGTVGHATGPALPSQEDLDALQPGLYTLDTDTPYDADAESTETYRITHTVIDLQYDTYRTKLHTGLARAGMVPVGVYFDYDNDGLVDVDMALNFVRDIPLVGGRLARSYNPVVTQNLYSIFVSERGNAEYTSVEDMSNDAEAASSLLWKFVMDQYEAIKAWVFEHLPERSSDPDK